jgi:hypothetical protein
MKKEEMDGHVARMREMRNASEILKIRVRLGRRRRRK